MNTPRAAGALIIDEKLHSALALCRVRLRMSKAPVLELDAVRAVEAELGTPVSDEVWAWLAAVGGDPRQVVLHTADAREEHRLPRRFIAFEHDRQDDIYFCVVRDPVGSGRRGIWEWDGQQAIERWHDMPSFIRSFYGLGRASRGSEPPGYDVERLVFQPMLVATPALVNMRRVCHAKFGDGVILREMRGPVPKLEIDFGRAGRKLVLASFVHEYDDRIAPPVVELQNAPGPSAPSSGQRRGQSGRRPRRARRRRGAVRPAA